MFKTTRMDSNVTFAIAILAFMLSYSKLVELAERAGYASNMAHLWPLIVDGLAVVATRAVMKLDKPRYAWFLLISATIVSIAAAVAQSVFPQGPLHPVIAAVVSVVPPLCLLAAPHLAVQLMRHGKINAEAATVEAPVAETPAEVEAAPVTIVEPTEVATPAQVAAEPQINTNVATQADVAPTTEVAPEPEVAPAADVAATNAHMSVADLRAAQREEALRLVIETNMSLRSIAKQVGTSDMSVGRWAKEAGIDTRARKANGNRNAAQDLFQVV